MAYSRSMSNDELKHRILNVYAKFVSDVEPNRLSDWLVQDGVISVDQWERIRHENPTMQDKCRALLSHLFSTQHPRAFLSVLNALSERSHYLLKYIENQESGYGFHVQQDKEFSLQEEGDSGSKEKSKESLSLEQRIEIDLLRKELDRERTEKESLRLSNKALKDELDKEKARYDSQTEELEKLGQELETTKTNSEMQILKLDQNLKQEQIEKKQLIIEYKEKKRSLNDKFRYMLDPVLIQKIKPNAAELRKPPIRGLTILDKELFLVSDHRSEVDIYDSIQFSFNRRWNLMELSNPFDIRSCMKNICLYIFDIKDAGQCKEILRIDPNGKLIKKWSTGDGYGRLSVTGIGTIIVTIVDKNRINEFSPAGQLIRELNLSVVSGVRHPLHAIKLSNGHFVICHGIGNDDLHRVCLVDADGKLKKSFGDKRGSNIGEMDSPVNLSIDGNGFVMVADHWNSRILLLDQNLEFKREIFSKERNHGLRCPNRILLDESNGRLFVADIEWDSVEKLFKDGIILIFDFK